MAVGGRREARERALSLLYEAYAKSLPADEVLSELPATPDPFAAELVSGVAREQPRIDDLISRYSVDWAIERMPVVDRTLLRMAVYELLEHDDVPTAAVISEAVELAKAYSTDESGRFVNGVLGAVAGEVRRSQAG